MLKNLVFPVLATLAAAASSNSCSFSTTISAASAVQNLNSCPTLSGDITVTGDQLASVDLSQVNAIDADLLFFNSSSITDINFGGLANVTGSLGFSALTQMHNIEFSALTAAKELSFVSLPSLAALNLGSGLATVSQLTLSDTALSSIDSLLNFETIGVLNVNNNKNVTSIDLSSLQNVTEGLTLSFNSDNATVRLDKLQWASNLTLQDIGDVSIGSLQYVNGSFVVAYNSFDSVSFDSLSNVGASLQIFANDNLESLNLANLTEIDGEFHVFNNTYLEEIELDSLQTVKGAVSMKGDFGNFTLPDLKEVDGDFSIESTSDDFSCEAFDKLHKNNKIKGHNYNCSSPSTTQSSSAASSTSKSSSKSSGASSTSGSSSSSTSTSSTRSSSAAAFSPATFLGCVVAAAAALLI
ncbi:hypothetical protein OXX59_007489 [Metschnikowia pulcherrima]